MRILFIVFFLFQGLAYGQISKPGVQAQNGGSTLGRALTLNCDGNCIICTLTGTTMNITFSASCSASGGNFLLLQDGSFLLLQSGGKIIL